MRVLIILLFLQSFNYLLVYNFKPNVVIIVIVFSLFQNLFISLYFPYIFLYQQECEATKDCRLEDILQGLFSRKFDEQSFFFFCPSYLISFLLSFCRCQKDVSYESLLSIKELPAILPISIQRNTPGIHIQLPQSFNFTKFSTIVISSFFSILSVGSHYSCIRICFVKCYLLS